MSTDALLDILASHNLTKEDYIKLALKLKEICLDTPVT